MAERRRWLLLGALSLLVLPSATDAATVGQPAADPRSTRKRRAPGAEVCGSKRERKSESERCDHTVLVNSCECDSSELADTCELDGPIDELPPCKEELVDDGPARTPAPRGSASLRVHFLDVGTGTCQLVEPGDPKCPVTVVDCGTKGAVYAMTRAEVLEYVDDVVGDRTMQIVISHPDGDHYSYLGDIAARGLASGRLRSIWYGGSAEAYANGSQTGSFQHAGRRRQLVDLLGSDRPRSQAPYEVRGFEKKATTATSEVRSSPYALPTCGGVEMSAIAVNSGSGSSTNGQSLVIAIRAGQGDAAGLGLVLAADAERSTQNVITGRLPRAPGCQFADHGGTARTFFEGRMPAEVVLAASHHGASSYGSNDDCWSQFWRTGNNRLRVVFSAGAATPKDATRGRETSASAMKFGHPRRLAYFNYMRADDTPALAVPGHEVIYCTSQNNCERVQTTRAAYVTATNGTVVMQWDGEETRAECMKPTEPRGPDRAYQRIGC